MSVDPTTWLRSDRRYSGPGREERQALAVELLAAGLELLTSQPLSVTPDGFSLARAISRANNKRPSNRQLSSGAIYDRLWSSPAEFERDVVEVALRDWFGTSHSDELKETAAALDSAMSEPDVASGSFDERLQRLAKLGADANWASNEPAASVAVRRAIEAVINARAVQGKEQGVEELINASLESDRTSQTDFRDLYIKIAAMLEAEPDPAIFGDLDEEGRRAAFEGLASVLAMVADGALLRGRLQGSRDISVRSRQTGETEQWSSFALGVYLIVKSFFRPIGADSDNNH